MIPTFKVFMPPGITETVNQILHSGHLAKGEYTEHFQKKVSEYINNEYFLTLSSNSVFFALELLGIKPGDDVISSPMSCLMTNQPIASKRANVVWCDIDPYTGTLDPDDLRLKITKNTRAIIHYHWGGVPGYIDEVVAIGDEFGIPVIEEASMAFGSLYKGERLGFKKSHITCFTFTPVRLPNAINGTGISFRDKELFEKALLMRDYGIDRKNYRKSNGEINENCDISLTGSSNVLDNLSSYIGYSQMGHVENLIQIQQENAINWVESLKTISSFKSLVEDRPILPNYWVFPIVTEERDKLYDILKVKGFSVTLLHNRNDNYSLFKNSKVQLLKGVDLFEKIQLNLPCGWWISKEDLINDFK